MASGKKQHPRPEHIPEGDPCTVCGHPFLWHRVRQPTVEYLREKLRVRERYFEAKRQERLEEAKLANTRLAALVQEYEQRPKHVTPSFKRKLFEAWWKTRLAAQRHQLATERLVKHLGRGPLSWKGRTYQAQLKEVVELEDI